MITILASLIVLPPLAAAGLIGGRILLGHGRGDAAEPATGRLAVGAGGLSLLALLMLDLLALVQGAPGQVRLGTWLSSGELEVAISFTLDPLALALASLAALICLLTLRFSVNYLHREPGFHRYFLVMSLFTAGMLLILTAGNLPLTFVGWELAGISSYLLIAYAYQRDRAAENATRAFVTNRIGDAGFLLGIFFCLSWIGSLEWPALAASHPDGLQAGLILLTLMLPALAKSAQLPFAGWIARALEGPTPSSAIFYGSLMVHAGVYLLIRLEPLFQQSPPLLPVLVLVGLLTAVYNWLTGLVQTDVKSSLMFATGTQIGLMVAECGLGWFDLAAWHLALHALWRSYQFLHAPAMMHLLTRPPRPLPAWLSKRQWLFHAALQRFWIDPAIDWLLVQPTRQLARDTQTFDEQVVNRLVGLPAQGRLLASLAGQEQPRATGQEDIVRAPGLLGALVARLAAIAFWFEQRLLFKTGGDGLLGTLRRFGSHIERIEDLLSRPRYLLLLIMATLVVIL